MTHRLQVRPCRGSGESVWTGRVPSQARGRTQDHGQNVNTKPATGPTELCDPGLAAVTMHKGRRLWRVCQTMTTPASTNPPSLVRKELTWNP